jgi:hypothetical protein
MERWNFMLWPYSREPFCRYFEWIVNWMEDCRLAIGRLICLSPPLWPKQSAPLFPIDMDPLSERANGLIVIRAVVQVAR